MRTRARVLVVIAFVVTLPALVVGMIRIHTAEVETEMLVEAGKFSEIFHRIQFRLEGVRAAAFRIESEPSPDARRALRVAFDATAREILDAEANVHEILRTSGLRADISAWRDTATDEPLLPRSDPLRRLKDGLRQSRELLEPYLTPRRGAKPESAAFRRAHESLNGDLRETAVLVQRTRALIVEQARRTSDAISRAGRDQLVLFLLLILLLPMLFVAGPRWMIAPIERLRGVAKRVASGRGREIFPSSDDEVGDVARALRVALGKLEDNDHKKTHKIFEMRKLVRALLARLDEPVLVVGRGGHIDYVSKPTTELFGAERHHIEGKNIEDICFSPTLCEAIDQAREGDVSEEDVPVVIEPANGRVLNVKASVLSVQDQDGRVSRVVVVIHA